MISQQASFRGIEIDAKNILARAYEDLEDFDRARRIATEALALAKASRRSAAKSRRPREPRRAAEQTGTTCPKRCTLREQREQDQSFGRDITRVCAYDLTNRAELLIRLGRGDDAETAAEGDRDERARTKSFRRTRADAAASPRCARFAPRTEQRFADVLTHASEAMTIAGKVDPESTAFVLAEYARAMLGQKAQQRRLAQPRLRTSRPRHGAGAPLLGGADGTGTKGLCAGHSRWPSGPVGPASRAQHRTAVACCGDRDHRGAKPAPGARLTVLRCARAQQLISRL